MDGHQLPFRFGRGGGGDGRGSFQSQNPPRGRGRGHGRGRGSHPSVAGSPAASAMFVPSQVLQAQTPLPASDFNAQQQIMQQQQAQRQQMALQQHSQTANQDSHWNGGGRDHGRFGHGRGRGGRGRGRGGGRGRGPNSRSAPHEERGYERYVLPTMVEDPWLRLLGPTERPVVNDDCKVRAQQYAEKQRQLMMAATSNSDAVVDKETGTDARPAVDSPDDVHQAKSANHSIGHKRKVDDIASPDDGIASMNEPTGEAKRPLFHLPAPSVGVQPQALPPVSKPVPQTRPAAAGLAGLLSSLPVPKNG